jgi:hypothetical protein
MAENAGQVTVSKKKKISFRNKIIALFIAGNIRKLYYRTPVFLLILSE